MRAERCRRPASPVDRAVRHCIATTKLNSARALAPLQPETPRADATIRNRRPLRAVATDLDMILGQSRNVALWNDAKRDVWGERAGKLWDVFAHGGFGKIAERLLPKSATGSNGSIAPSNDRW